MYSLYIDTHLDKIIIILFKDGKVIEKCEKVSTMSHSINAMDMIKNILEVAGINKKDINEIIVVNGPGSFTGVRIGVTLGKTLGYCLNIPCKTVTSLEIKAVNISENKIVVESDKNGKYIGSFNSNNELIEEYKYLSNREFEEFSIKNRNIIIDNVDIDYEKVYKFLQKRDYTMIHNVNPLYIKNIEV